MTKNISRQSMPMAQRLNSVSDDGCGCEVKHCCQSQKPDSRRRLLLSALLGWLVAPFVMRGGSAQAADKDPEKMRAQPGDQLVFKSGDRKGEVIKFDDVVAGEKPLFGYPYDPVNDVLRKGSRMNQILVLRLPPDELSDEVLERAVDGVIAYSAICTHENCPVSGWHPEHEQFICPCHETHYDPKDGARVVSGPAKRALPALPLTVEDGVLVAAGELTGKVGKRKPS